MPNLSKSRDMPRGDAFPAISDRAKREFFSGRGLSRLLEAGCLTALHIRASSNITIRTWPQPFVQVQLASRIYPFALHHNNHSIYLKEKPSSPARNEPSKVIIYAPYRINLLNISLSNAGRCESDILPQLANVFAQDQAKIIVQSLNLFSQSYDLADVNGTLISQKFNRSPTTRLGEVIAVNGGSRLTLNGAYKESQILALKGSRLLHRASATKIESLFDARTAADMKGAPFKMTVETTDGSSPKVTEVPVRIAPAQLQQVVQASLKKMMLRLAVGM